MRSLVLLGAVVAVLVTAGAAAPAPERRLPEIIQLPRGFQPEGIATSGPRFFVGSIPTGAIYSGDLRTGRGGLLVRPQEGRAAIGVAVSGRKLFVAGGPTGKAFVYDARTGVKLDTYTLTREPTFINDVVVTPEAVWFTDSLRPFLYRITIRRDGSLGPQAQAVPLTGDIEYQEGFNVNGIDATPDGFSLVIVQSNTGMVFHVETSGVAHEIDLGAGGVPNGDGVLLDGHMLYVVQNRLNQIAVIEVSEDMHTGEIVRLITHEEFDVPTTIDSFRTFLYAVNARFGTEPTPSTKYWLTRVPKE
jgi:hypothetical protein